MILGKNPVLELDIQARQLNDEISAGFTVCFNYFNSGSNRLKVEFDNSINDGLVFHLLFYACKPVCQLFVDISGRKQQGKHMILLIYYKYVDFRPLYRIALIFAWR